MSKVAVLDTEKKVLAPCHPAAARRLLKEAGRLLCLQTLSVHDYPEDVHRAGCRH